MDHQIAKKNRKFHKKKKSSGEKSSSFKVYNPSTDLNSMDSIYEINILEQNSIISKRSSNLSDQEKLAIANVFPVSMEKGSKGSHLKQEKGIEIFANPFIESYYPVLQKSFSEDTFRSSSSLVKTRKSDKEQDKASIVLVEKDVKENDHEKNDDSTEEKIESTDFSSQSKTDQDLYSLCDSNFKENLRRQIIETCSSILENEKKLNNMTRTKMFDKEQLHLHHHEHHHYYYISSVTPETEAFKNECVQEKASAEEEQREIKPEMHPEMHPEIQPEVEPEIQPETTPQPPLPKRTSSKKKKTLKTQCEYSLTDCSLKKDSTKFTPKIESANAVPSHPAKFDVKNLAESKLSECKLLDLENHSNDSCRKMSSSIDSLIFLNKKSDLIKTHNFSESNLSKYGSENTVMANSATTTTTNSHMKTYFFKSKKSIEKKVERSNSKIDLIDKLKNLTEIIGPDWKLEKKKLPNASYVKCSSLNPETLQTTCSSKSSKTQISSTSFLIRENKENENSSKIRMIKSKSKQINISGKRSNRFRLHDSNLKEKSPKCHSKDSLPKFKNSISKPKITKISIREKNNDVDILMSPKREATGIVQHLLSGSGSAKKIRLGRRQSISSLRRALQGKIPGTSQFTVEGNDMMAKARGHSLKTWTDKLKRELKDIKKELRKIEERHREKKEQAISDGSEPGVAVYSSKTYILGANNVCCLQGESNQSVGSKDGFLYRNKNFSPNEREKYHLCYTPCTQLWRRAEQQHQKPQQHHYVAENAKVNKSKLDQRYLCRRQPKTIKCVQSEGFPLERGSRRC